MKMNDDDDVMILVWYGMGLWDVRGHWTRTRTRRGLGQHSTKQSATEQSIRIAHCMSLAAAGAAASVSVVCVFVLCSVYYTHTVWYSSVHCAVLLLLLLLCCCLWCVFTKIKDKVQTSNKKKLHSVQKRRQVSSIIVYDVYENENFILGKKKLLKGFFTWCISVPVLFHAIRNTVLM